MTRKFFRPLMTMAMAGMLSMAAPLIADAEVDRLNLLLSDVPGVTAERRGEIVVLRGHVSNDGEAAQVASVATRHPDVISLVREDIQWGDRMIDVDVIIVVVRETELRAIGFDFLQLINLQYQFFDSRHRRPTSPGLGAPGSTVVTQNHQWGRLFSASVDYNVNIANATDESVSVLARPHLSTLDGQTARFQSGGEIVFRVIGINSGDIKPFSFGIDLEVTPTLLPSENGTERVLLDVNAERLTVLGRLFVSEGNDDVNFDKVAVSSKAVLPLDETLVLSGLYQHETRRQNSGVPILRDIPLVRLLFSRRISVDEVNSTVIFITPRDASRIDDRNQESISDFVAYRREYLSAVAGDEEDKIAFKERHPSEWYRPKPNQYASHLFMTSNSRIYRQIRGEDLRIEPLDGNIMTVYSAADARAQRETEQRRKRRFFFF